MSHAKTCLDAHFEQLVDWPDVGYHAGAIADTHRTNRAKYRNTTTATHHPTR